MQEQSMKIHIENNIHTMDIYETSPGTLTIEWYELGDNYCIGSIETDSQSFLQSLQQILAAS